ncbi:MAG: ATP-dependent helicase HrpB [Dongiaceae bacterium]
MALPIEAVLPELRRILAAGTGLVLQAPPGAGKTTAVPPALLDEPWVAGRRILMLEPRRLAARAAARRMAALRGEAVGETVGYRIRLDSRIGPRTRIEVLTEGILTRLLQEDPGLAGVAAVIFDEVHERSLQGDLGLALCLEARAALRPDLRLVAMSATLEGERLAALLGAPVLRSEGRAFPVETRFLAREPAGRLEEEVAAAVRRGLAESAGDLLVFLPGEAEIRRTLALLQERVGDDVALHPLYGSLPAAAQDAAIQAAPPGQRKVVLATAIAETSLTIDGVRGVIDGGLSRVPRFDPARGMTRLATVRVSRAAADQRRGRAGRQAPGTCWRLWTAEADRALAPQGRPEILEADLAPLALELAAWGAAAGALAWLDPPPAAALAQAHDLLQALGALDPAGRITAHGRALLALPLHPRLAHMVLRGQALGLGTLACRLAALLGERDILRRRPGAAAESDLRPRLELLGALGHAAASHGLAVDRAAAQRVLESARDLERRLGIPPGRRGAALATGPAGLLLAFAWPDRIARRRPGPEPRYALANGGGAFLAGPEPLAAAEFLVVPELDGERREARIFLAAPVERAELEAHLADRIVAEDLVRWDSREEAVLARRRRRLGALTLDDRPLPDPDPAAVAAALIAGIRELGLGCLPWNDALRAWRERVAFAARLEPEAGWPDLTDAALSATLEDWLAPFLAGCARRAHLARVDLAAALAARLTHAQSRTLDRLAPTHVAVPTGNRLPIDYAGARPVLAVRLQEMLGLAETPTVAGGRVKLLLHLLSPARRPLAVTDDLASFWAGPYRQVRAEMRGQYPRHPWPDDPLQAMPTARAKPRGR